MNNRQYTDKENAKKLYETFNKVYKTGKPEKGFDWEIIRKDCTKRYVEASVSILKDAGDKPIGFRGIVWDVTERKQAEEALQHERDKLQDALDKIKTLSGLLPICSNCKKIRDNKGYWSQIESYIAKHSESDFTHSICPECVKSYIRNFIRVIIFLPGTYD